MRDDDATTVGTVEEVFPETLLPPRPPLTNIVFVAIPAAALAACGGGAGGSAGSAGTPAPAPAPAAALPPTPIQAGRLLAQSAMGATKAENAKVVSMGYAAYLDEQFAAPRATSFWDWMVGKGFNAATNKNSNNGFDPAVWRQLISGNDQLRQRVGVALIDFLVVGIDGIQSSWNGFAAAGYLDVLWDGAFGNFRDLIEKISLNPAMASYLTFLGNRKANTGSGSVPDENYARELMQLFTLGVSQLNMDGTVKTSGATALETYTQDDVTGLARVFTGFVLASSDDNTPDRWRVPLIQRASDHETGVSTFLGATVPAGTDGFAALKIALDTIFAHPNVPPFISKQLIQRLVTSNPSPAYVTRIANVFANNGSGVRGDLKAVIRAILLDTEARSDIAATGTSFGKLREPVTRLTGWARAFGVTSPSDAWKIGDTSSTTSRLAQSIGHSPSVFNFFRPGYTPPNSQLSQQSLVAPEFQITNEPTVIAYLNYMRGLIQSGTDDVKADYTDILTRAGDSQVLVDEVNLVIAGGQVSAATVTTIKAAVDSIAMTATGGPQNRVYIAIMLIMASPEYLTQK